MSTSGIKASVSYKILTVLIDFDILGDAEISDRLADVATLLLQLADIFTLLCIVELALSFSVCFANSRNTLNSVARYFTVFIGVVLFALMLAALIRDELNYTEVFEDRNYHVTAQLVDELYGVYSVIQWIMALFITGLAIFVIVTAYARKSFRGVSPLVTSS